MNKITMLGTGNGGTLDLYNTCFVIQNEKGNLLVELTFYNKEDYCYKGKNYKNYTFKKEAKDKEANNCSTCNIF